MYKKRTSSWVEVIIFFLLLSLKINAANRYGQITIPLLDKKNVSIKKNKEDSSVLIKLNNLSKEKLDQLKNYNTNLIKKLFIERSEDKTEISLYLKDSKLDSTITIKDYPLRLVISIYEKEFFFSKR